MRTQKSWVGIRNPQHNRARQRASRSRLRLIAAETMEKRLLFALSVAEPLTVPGDVRSGPAAKVGALGDLYADYQLARQFNTSAAFEADQALVPTVGNSVVIDAVADGDPAQLESDLRGLGMANVARAGRIVSGILPIDAIDDMALLTSLRFAQPALNSTNVGAVTSQGDASKKTDLARSTFSGVAGITGTGVTIGVLSDSFDTGPGSYATDVGTLDLPAGVNVLQDSAGGTDEGRAMLQLAYDTAPGSTLAFATANGGQANFATNITNLRTVAGADVIVDDVIYFAEPMFQDGVIAQAVDATVAAGVPYYSSSGNQARQSYESVWRNGVARADSAIPSAAGASHFFGGTSFDFDPGAGVDDMQSFTLANGAQALISFQWDQPFFSVSGGSGSLNELDAYILNAAGTQVISTGGVNLSQGGDASEVFSFTNTSGATQTYNLMFCQDTSAGGPTPGFVKYVEFRSSIPTQFATNSGAAYGHTNAANADSIAAAPWFNTPAFGVNPPIVESFSSAGGTAIRFTTAGVPIVPVVRQTPDFTGPDGGNTTFFSSDSGADADAFPNFFGTSAAAPEVAALAALIRGVNFALSPAQIHTVLQNSSVDMDDPTTGGFDVGVDFRTGFGLVDGYKALAQVIPVGIWTGLGDATSFHQNTNWSQDTLPGATIDAKISLPASNPTIVVSQPESVKSLTSSEAVTVTAAGTLTLAQSSSVTSLFSIAGTVTLTAGGSKILTSTSLSITGAGKIDLTNNEMFVTAGITTVRDHLLNARIRTSITPGALGYLDVGGGVIRIRFTYLGDTNLDRNVDVTDLGNLATNYGVASGAVWVMGDFDYNASVTVADLGGLATFFGQTVAIGPAFPAALLASSASSVGASSETSTRRAAAASQVTSAAVGTPPSPFSDFDTTRRDRKLALLRAVALD